MTTFALMAASGLVCGCVGFLLGTIVASGARPEPKAAPKPRRAPRPRKISGRNSEPEIVPISPNETREVKRAS